MKGAGHGGDAGERARSRLDRVVGDRARRASPLRDGPQRRPRSSPATGGGGRGAAKPRGRRRSPSFGPHGLFAGHVLPTQARTRNAYKLAGFLPKVRALPSSGRRGRVYVRRAFFVGVRSSSRQAAVRASAWEEVGFAQRARRRAPSPRAPAAGIAGGPPARGASSPAYPRARLPGNVREHARPSGDVALSEVITGPDPGGHERDLAARRGA